MTGSQIKRETWRERREQLQGNRHTIWQWVTIAQLQHRRPVTTAEVATMFRSSVLSVRPRITELIQLGFMRCTGKRGHEGLYEPIGIREAQAAVQK